MRARNEGKVVVMMFDVVHFVGVGFCARGRMRSQSIILTQDEHQRCADLHHCVCIEPAVEVNIRWHFGRCR